MGRDRPFPSSVCHGCIKHRLVETDRGAQFIRCTDPDLPKYRTQPITACPQLVSAELDD